LSTDWVAPLAVSGAVGLLATPLARKLAVRIGLVDRPAYHKAHRRVTPYMGGIAIAVAVIAGRLTEAPTRLDSVVTGLATVLAVMGLTDDDRNLAALPRLGVEAACAAAAVTAGLRITGTGVSGLDVALTVLLLVVVTNATNLMDNLDGLAAGVTAAGAAGAGVLAWLGHNSTTTADAASLVGACLAFLVFNAKPASIFMGDAGSLFLGFLLMAVAIRAGAPLPEPASLLVPLLIVALPLVDTVTVTLARLRHGRSPLQGGRDHLSHRLAGTGIGSGPAVAVLVGVQGAMSALAVMAGRRTLPMWVALAAAVLLLSVVVVVAAQVRVYSQKPVGLPRMLVWGFPAVVTVVVLLAAPAVLGLLRAHGPGLAAEADLEKALSAARSGHLSEVGADLAQAREQLAQAHADLDGPLTSAGLAYPVLGNNLEAARTLVGTGLTLSHLGPQLTTLQADLNVHNGTIPLKPLAKAAADLQSASDSVSASAAHETHLSHAYLLPTVAHVLTRFESEIGPAQQDLRNAAATATYLPQMLGIDGPRRYFLAIQNPDESRATGGLIGNWGVLIADQGHIQIGTFGRLEQLNVSGSQNRTLDGSAAYLTRYQRFDPANNWQNVNMSPDFPTVGSVIADLYPQSGGTSVDGVIAVDPTALKALLQLTGPVSVSGWPVPIRASNVLTVTLHDEYVSYLDEGDRADFLSNVARAAFAAFGQLNLSDPARLISALRPIASQGDVQVYSSHPAEEAYLEQIDLAGALPPVESASLAITTQNIAANKIDYFLHRSIDYQATLTPNSTGGAAPTTAEEVVNLSVGLDNTAPASGLPPSIIGPYSPQFQPGEESTFLSIYTPLGFDSATLNGAPTSLSSGTELGRNVYSDFVNIASGQTVTVGMSLTGQIRLLPGGWYELDLPHQPVVNPDQLTVDVTLADGWRVTGVHGATQVSPNTVRANVSQSKERSVWVQVAPDASH